MRWFVILLLAGCSSMGAPGPDEDAAEPPADICGDARACTAADEACATYPFESLPERCRDVCYLGRCCANFEDTWHVVIYDCARELDAGVAP
jgi:hypothetical protein